MSQQEEEAVVARYRYVVMSNAHAGREEEFNQWYDDVHLPQILAIDGIVSAERSRLFEVDDAQLGGAAPYRFLAVYEIETSDIDGVLVALTGGAKSRTPSDALDLEHTAAWMFESLTRQSAAGEG